MSHGSDKRKFERYPCNIKTKFDYFEGDPETVDIDLDVPEKGKGSIIDISKGGSFIISNNRITVGIPVIIYFEIKKKEYTVSGRVVRTGSLENNPSEVAVKFLPFLSKGNYYIAVEFSSPLDDLNPDLL